MEYPNPFDGAEVISTYSDAQAIEDGILVAVNRQDRVSRAVWEFLVEHAPEGAQPPNCWPVEMLGWFQASKIGKTEAAKLIAELGAEGAQKKFERMVADRKALALTKGIISTHARQAVKVYEENTRRGDLQTLCDAPRRKTLWLKYGSRE